MLHSVSIEILSNIDQSRLSISGADRVQIGCNSIENIDTIDQKTLKIEQKHTIFYCFDTIDTPVENS
jgi:hypothetical protein